MECPNCRLENPPGTVRCDCGHAFSDMKGETRTCPACAETIQAAATKCRYCGESLVKNRKSPWGMVIGIGAVAVVVSAWAFYALQNPMQVRAPFTAGSPEHQRRVEPPVVTMADYRVIKKGMSYKTVRGIIGADGVEISRSELAGTTTIMYSWKNPNGSNMNAMFQDGALVTKAQFGLP
jgi:hypothetical protein